MPTPHLIAIRNAPPSVRAHAARLAGPDAFVVVDGGTFGGRTWCAGEVVTAESGVRSGDLVILAPRGVGRPRLGRVVDGQLLGEAGEPCHPARWQVVGRAAQVVAEAAPARFTPPAPVALAQDQLALFGWRQAA